MIDTGNVACKEYASHNNLKFSTESDPVKGKPKSIDFLRIPREVPSLLVICFEVPWVDKPSLSSTPWRVRGINQYGVMV